MKNFGSNLPPQALYNMLTQLARYKYLNESVGEADIRVETAEMFEPKERTTERKIVSPPIKKPVVIQASSGGLFDGLKRIFGQK